jgi:hypothetical protein
MKLAAKWSHSNLMEPAANGQNGGFKMGNLGRLKS